jgi:hypothetical protein
MVKADPDLRISESHSETQSGQIVVHWAGVGDAPQGDRIIWSSGGLSARAYSDKFIEKLCEIAQRIDAVVYGADGERYSLEGDSLTIRVDGARRKFIALESISLPPIFSTVTTRRSALLLALACWAGGFVSGLAFMLMEGWLGGRHWLATGVSVLGVGLFAISSILLAVGLVSQQAGDSPLLKPRARVLTMLVGGLIGMCIAWIVLEELGPRSGGLGRFRGDWSDWQDHLLGWASVGIGFLCLMPVVLGAGYLIEEACSVVRRSRRKVRS